MIRDNLAGKVFGRLTVVGLGESDKYSNRRWMCECIHLDGAIKIVFASRSALLCGNVVSCGCLSREGAAARALDLTGRSFGRLIVLGRDGMTSSGGVAWRTKCACGALRVVSSTNLVTGHTVSCGCLSKENAARRLRLLPPKAGTLFKGVISNGKKYQAYTSKVHLGTFPTSDNAARAYDAAAFAKWGTDCYLNFPEDYGLPRREPCQ